MRNNGSGGRGRRGYVVAIVAVVVLAVGCASDDDDGAAPPEQTSTTTNTADEVDGGTTSARPFSTTEAPAPFDSFRGVTAAEIELGAIWFDSDLLAELGLSAVSFGDHGLAYRTFVDEINARGGIHGRTLVLTDESYLPTTATEAEPLCIRLTEDIGVFAVFGSFLAGSVAANECIVGQHETAMVGGVHTAAEFDAARAPWISTLMSFQRMYPAGVELLDQEGFLDGDPRVGIVAVVAELADVESSLVPAYEAKGIEPELYELDLFIGDLIAAGGATDVIRQRMDVDGIELVVLAYGAIIRTPQDLLAAGWDTPIVSLAPNEFMETIDVLAGAPPEASDGVIGLGGLTPDEKFDLPSSQDCVATFEAANPDIEVRPVYQVPPGEPRWIVAVLSACAEVRLFEQIAVEAGVDLTNESFAAAAERLGDVEVPGTFAASLGTDKYDADDAVRLVVWDSSVGANGGIRSISELLVVD